MTINKNINDAVLTISNLIPNSEIYAQQIIGKLDTLEKGMGLIVTFVTLLIICQILPLAFAVFVKFGRG